MKKHESELLSVLKKYCLKLKIFEDFLKDLLPIYREVNEYIEDMELAKKITTRRKKKLDTKAINTRLKEIEIEFKMDPEYLLRLFGKFELV